MGAHWQGQLARLIGTREKKMTHNCSLTFAQLPAPPARAE
jgi:hypothetical protein